MRWYISPRTSNLISCVRIGKWFSTDGRNGRDNIILDKRRFTARSLILKPANIIAFNIRYEIK